MLGVIDDVTRRTPTGFAVEPASGSSCSARPARSCPGSEWAHVVHGHLGGLPPMVDLAAERALGRAAAPRAVGLLTSAHDLSDGGLAQTLVESACAHGVGATVALAGDAFVALFAESTARAVVTVTDGDAERADRRWPQRHGVPLTALGSTGGTALEVEGQFTVALADVRDAWTATLPAALG